MFPWACLDPYCLVLAVLALLSIGTTDRVMPQRFALHGSTDADALLRKGVTPSVTVVPALGAVGSTLDPGSRVSSVVRGIASRQREKHQDVSADHARRDSKALPLHDSSANLSVLRSNVLRTDITQGDSGRGGPALPKGLALAFLTPSVTSVLRSCQARQDVRTIVYCLVLALRSLVLLGKICCLVQRIALRTAFSWHHWFRRD